MSEDNQRTRANTLFPLYEMSGSRTAMGRSFGRQAGDKIRKSIEIYRSAFEQKQVDWDQALCLAKAFMPGIRRYDATLMDEMMAMADGADLKPEEIVAINARTELLYGIRPQAQQGPEDDIDGCTGAIAMGAATANGHTLHGQNWDWKDECADSAVVMRLSPEEGPSILTFVEAGILARCGFNSAGISLTGNFLQGDRDYGRDGVPAPMLRRQILSAESLPYAMRSVFESQRAFSNNLMISHAGGECINLETTPDEIFWIQESDGLLVHANHFISPAARARLVDVGLQTNADSLYRDLRVRRFLEGRVGNITVEDFKEVFADDYGTPKSVCRVPVEGPGGKTSSTVATIIMDTTDRVMWIARRPYNKPVSYQEYCL